MTILSIKYAENSTEACFDIHGQKFDRPNAGENKSEKDFMCAFKLLNESSQYETLMAHRETRYFDEMANHLESIDEDKFFDFCDANGIDA
jgi:hypothetical protein